MTNWDPNDFFARLRSRAAQSMPGTSNALMASDDETAKKVTCLEDPELACLRVTRSYSGHNFKRWELALLGIGAIALVVSMVVISDPHGALMHYHRVQSTVSRRTSQLDLIWLMSYPFSGVEVTTRIAQNCSNTTIATNYGQFLQFPDKVYAGYVSRSIVEGQTNAPYRFNAYLDVPSKQVLTRTHCSGYCREEEKGECKIEDFSKSLIKLSNFYISCASGIEWTPRLGERVVYYNPSRVKKILLQFRNPFSIVLSRYKRYMEKEGILQTVDRFAEYCENHDKQYGSVYKTTFYTKEEAEASKGVMCHGEFYRIVHWYNQAFHTANFMGIDPVLFYFDDYYTKPQENVDLLLDTAGLSEVDGSVCEVPFANNYESLKLGLLYYTRMQEVATRKFIDLMANAQTKHALKHYFDTGKRSLNLH